MVHNIPVAIVLLILATTFAVKPLPRSAGSTNSGSISTVSGSTDPTEFDSEIWERIRNGTDAGSALGQALGEGNFRDSLQKIGTNIVSFLGALGPLASIALSFISTADSTELTLMKEKFKEVNNKLDIITPEFEEVKNAIDWNTVTVSYETCERKIRAAMVNLIRIYDHEGSAREQEKDYFIEQHDSHFSNSLQKLYDATINEDHVFSSNILDTVAIQTQNLKRKFEQFSLGLVQLLVQGVIVRISYSAMKEQETQHLEQEWDRKMLALKRKLQEVSDEIKSRYLTQLRSDTEDMIRRSSELNNEELMRQVHRFLTEKYEWRYFFVAVYDDFAGDDKHYVSVCGGDTFFHTSPDKNIVVASQDKSRKIQNHRNWIRWATVLGVSRQSQSCQGTNFDSRASRRRSRALVENLLAYADSKCSPNQLHMAVEIHNGFYSSNPNGHRDMRKIIHRRQCNCRWRYGVRLCDTIYWNHMIIAFG